MWRSAKLIADYLYPDDSPAGKHSEDGLLKYTLGPAVFRRDRRHGAVKLQSRVGFGIGDEEVQRLVLQSSRRDGRSCLSCSILGTLHAGEPRLSRFKGDEGQHQILKLLTARCVMLRRCEASAPRSGLDRDAETCLELSQRSARKDATLNIRSAPWRLPPQHRGQRAV